MIAPFVGSGASNTADLNCTAGTVTRMSRQGSFSGSPQIEIAPRAVREATEGEHRVVDVNSSAGTGLVAKLLDALSTTRSRLSDRAGW